MGAVYRAFDSKLRRKVALKVLHPDLAVPDAAARLVREARAAAALAHPNTIAIHDLGEIDGTVFLVMELVSGVPLRAYVGDPAVPLRQKLRWLVDIARGLGAAHKAGLVHRDVKPTNVMVSDDGVVKVLDFGLAKPLEAASFHTDVGLVVGTPRYMAPELFTGMRADARSDQYAFGVTAYELLSGAHPGGPTGPVPAALDTLVPEIGPAVARVIARTLSRAAGERFATMNEIASELEEQIGTTRTSELREVPPPTRREGLAARGETALALAPTELPASLVKEVGERPGSGRVVRVAAVLGVVAIAGAYAAMTLLGDGHGPAAIAPLPSSATNDGAVAAADLVDAEADAQESLLVEPAVDDASDAADASTDAPDDAELDADVAPDATTRVFHLDDFVDPWSKPAPKPPAH